MSWSNCFCRSVPDKHDIMCTICNKFGYSSLYFFQVIGFLHWWPDKKKSGNFGNNNVTGSSGHAAEEGERIPKTAAADTDRGRPRHGISTRCWHSSNATGGSTVVELVPASNNVRSWPSRCSLVRDSGRKCCWHSTVGCNVWATTTVDCTLSWWDATVDTLLLAKAYLNWVAYTSLGPRQFFIFSMGWCSPSGNNDFCRCKNRGLFSKWSSFQ